jgi:hypothetical protein
MACVQVIILAHHHTLGIAAQLLATLYREIIIVLELMGVAIRFVERQVAALAILQLRLLQLAHLLHTVPGALVNLIMFKQDLF